MHESLECSLAGTQPYRRLALDSMAFEEHEGVTRVWHRAVKHSPEPVIPRDKPWEGWGPYLYGTVMWDEGRLRMWYQCIGCEKGAKQRVCYAESSDGIYWKKPELGIYENEAGPNNIVDENRCHIPSVIRLPNPESPDRAYAMYGYAGDAGASVSYSPDGLRWRFEDDPKHQRLFSSSDVLNFFYDPYKDRFVCTWKTHNRHHRAVGVVFSEDGLEWTKPIDGPVFGADDLDPDATQVYGMPVFPYQGCYIGLPWIYHARIYKYGPYTAKRMYEAQEGSPCTVDVQMAWSWDLISWNRTPRREPFISLSQDGGLDSGQLYTARAPVIVGDKLFFYYGGFNKLHDDVKDTRGAIFVATLRLDGFCSFTAGDQEGTVIGRRELFRTPRVTINARCEHDGYVAAEIVDRWNNVIPGFSRRECNVFRGDSVSHELVWKTAVFPPEWVLPDKKVRFILRNAELYSYLPADVDESVEVES
jgi:hypothetical protein